MQPYTSDEGLYEGSDRRVERATTRYNSLGSPSSDSTSVMELGVSEMDSIRVNPLEGRYPAHVDTGLSYVGVTETSENHGPEVKKFLAHVGLDQGYPWCAAFTSYCLSKAGVREPEIRSARTRDFRGIAEYTRSDVKEAIQGGRMPLEKGMLTVHVYSKFRGHIGMILDVNKRTIRTVEGNTSGPNGEEGVFKKKRNFVGSNYLAPKYFVKVSYD